MKLSKDPISVDSTFDKKTIHTTRSVSPAEIEEIDKRHQG